MQPDTILVRTPKGDEILRGYGHEISANQRHALLVVDGKATVADLEGKAFWVSNLNSTLDELRGMGFVQEEGLTTSPEAGPVGEAAPKLQLKAQLAALAKELLGSNADQIIKKIEETDGTQGALEQALLTCKKIITLTINEGLADTVLQRGRKVIGK